ncbi:MAG: hypothetical protein KIT15_01970 [Xanthobacteraceae bacterium]|nr:hypothetical protein [Xanthobacteraceae bacterium]MCW5673321.1 hypothetical protein [Xanthobacteraceae bacterium]MCW5677568.1 hypothetical protein [Xanthobacteraceae bacterium]
MLDKQTRGVGNCVLAHDAAKKIRFMVSLCNRHMPERTPHRFCLQSQRVKKQNRHLREHAPHACDERHAKTYEKSIADFESAAIVKSSSGFPGGHQLQGSGVTHSIF